MPNKDVTFYWNKKKIIICSLRTLGSKGRDPRSNIKPSSAGQELWLEYKGSLEGIEGNLAEGKGVLKMSSGLLLTQPLGLIIIMTILV